MIASLLKERDGLKERYEELDNDRKELQKRIDDLEAEILEVAESEMVTRVDIDGASYTIKPEQAFYVSETKSDHSKKVELLKRIEELGYGDGITFFETGFMHATKLKKALNELPVDVVAKMVEDGLVSALRKCSIIKRSK